jgi:hypothetical protein
MDIYVNAAQKAARWHGGRALAGTESGGLLEGLGPTEQKGNTSAFHHTTPSIAFVFLQVELALSIL